MRERYLSDRDWLAQCFDELPCHIDTMSPSEWAESKRYLPPEATSLPGFYRFEVAPYIREILDCMSVDSPVRSLAWMKGAQVCATVGVLENSIGYFVDHVRNAPVMMVTADDGLAKMRLESYILPMLKLSGLDHLIRSSDENNPRKTGRTDKKIEWEGGGFLIPFGAQSANKLRSFSIRMLLRDEIDGWPDVVGKDGDPLELSVARTKGYEDSRKILDLSTPLLEGASKIMKRYLLGDQRKYHVCCVKCGFPQELRWRRTNRETGEVTGIRWDTDDGVFVPGSARYACCECGHEHINDDKTRLLAPENGAQWVPTAKSSSPDHRSYHLGALYSPVGMQTWDACVRAWLEAWDDQTAKPRDVPKLQVFYNNILGEPFRERGEKLRFETVSAHRRHDYRYGEIPNRWAERFCGSHVLLLTCAVDVHKDNLAVGVFGWCRGGRAVLVDYDRFEGDTEELENPKTWGRLRELIEGKVYIADDARRYRIQLTLIDSGYRADDVYRFTAEYAAGVFPVKGVTAPPKAALVREFSQYTTPTGTNAYGITVDIFKDRWHTALRRGWDEHGLQPEWFFNAPTNATDKQLKELTVETKRERIDPRTNQRVGFEWHRPSGAANELWDLLVYNTAALELISWNVCVGQLQMEQRDWQKFYDLIEGTGSFIEE